MHIVKNVLQTPQGIRKAIKMLGLVCNHCLYKEQQLNISSKTIKVKPYKMNPVDKQSPQLRNGVIHPSQIF